MTAIPRGDCCLLKWEDVDLRSNFIKVKTSKTGAMVEIPIWPTLRAELLKAQQEAENLDGYVYPEQAKMYQENPDGITFRIKRVLNEAGFQTEDEHERDHGLRRASIRGFHAFRVTWVTLALNNNVPLEIIRRITGHRTTEIVLKDISKMPYYLLKLLLTFPGEFYHVDNLNTAIKALYKKSGPKDGYREIKGISKELHNALRISDKETLKQVENICKMYGKTSLSDLLFKIVDDSIAYIPFKKR